MTNNKKPLHLNPFSARFSLDFFAQIPSSPGVYWMLDSKRNILFVGAADNLQQDLLRYRNLSPHQLQDQLWLLASRVQQIDWNPTPHKMAAEKMRTILLRQCSPPFNTKRKVHNSQFLILQFLPAKVILKIGPSPESPPSLSFGPWKNPVLLRKMQASLCRWIWWLSNEATLDRMPPNFMKISASRGAEIFVNPNTRDFPIAWQKSLMRYLNGTSDLFIDLGIRKLEASDQNGTNSIHRALLRSDIVILESFFRRNLQIKKHRTVASAENRLQ